MLNLLGDIKNGGLDREPTRKIETVGFCLVGKIGSPYHRSMATQVHSSQLSSACMWLWQDNGWNLKGGLASVLRKSCYPLSWKRSSNHGGELSVVH